MSLTPTPKKSASVKPAAVAKLDLGELQAQQTAGQEPEQKTGNQDGSYSFPAYEADRVHVRLTKKVNDPVKKEYVDQSTVQKLYPQQFERMESNGSFAEYDATTILHDPRPKAARAITERVAEPGEPKSPATPVSTLPSLQDAQNRYQQLYPELAATAASKSYEELVELIRAKDADAGQPEGGSE